MKATKEKLTKIGEFEIVRKIGEGGLAEIFLARQPSLNRQIAIKVLQQKISDNEELVKRFERESITLAQMSHPNIVHVIDRGEDNGKLYFAMEYIEGIDFKEVLKKDEWSLEKKLDIIVQVLKGLDYAHKNGVIHRDIKPANILIDCEGRALIADFGIAQLLRQPQRDRTETGMVMGTYAYMSPEQKDDSARVDLTTDIYAIGVMLYETLTGRKPMGRFKLPSEIKQDLSKAYDEIVIKALQEDPKDRFQKAVEIKDALLTAMHHGKQVPSATAGASEDSGPNIGNCSFLDTLRESPFSSTYLVEDRSSHRLFVIKKQNKPDVGLKEARLLSNLRHPNILQVRGAGSDDTKLVLVIDYAQGGSLADRLVKPMPWRDAIKIMIQIASGLDFAHKNNILHGSLSPANILFDSEDVVKVADFSLISHHDRNKANVFAPPERRKTKLGDIYSAGVIFYQLLTNRIPTLDSAGKFLWIDGNRSTTPELKQLIDKMLRTAPADRIQSFAEIQDTLCRLAGKTPVVVKPTIEPKTDNTITKLILWGALFLIALIMVILFLTEQIDF